MERKLASVQKIEKICIHPNAYSLELASVLGWKVCVKKGEFKEGDLCVYVEVDSVMPERPEFEFLRPRNFRIKTMRLRGQLSQGICFPLSILGEYTDDLGKSIKDGTVQVGTDVTIALDVKKHEVHVPAQLAGKIVSTFPSFCRKTDEIRIQSVPDVLTRHKGKKFYVTEKLDGSSITCFYTEGSFGVASRNFVLAPEENNAFWKAVTLDNIRDRLYTARQILGIDKLALQGELVGPGVQKNKYKLDQLSIRVFNLFDISKQEFISYHKLKEVCAKNGLPMVPVVDEDFTLDHTVDQLLELAKGDSSLYPTLREGLVFRPHIEAYDEDLGRLSFKAINNDFLLKHNE